jgi:hypothetical protein
MASLPYTGLVVAPTGTEGTGPANLAVFLVADCSFFPEIRQSLLVKSLKDISHEKFILTGKTLAEIKATVRVHRKKPQTRPARIVHNITLVKFHQKINDV